MTEEFRLPRNAYPADYELPPDDSALPEYLSAAADLLKFADGGKPEDIVKLKAMGVPRIAGVVKSLRDEREYPEMEWQDNPTSLAAYLHKAVYGDAAKDASEEDISVSAAGYLLLFLRSVGFDDRDIQDGLERTQLKPHERSTLNAAADDFGFAMDFGHFD